MEGAWAVSEDGVSRASRNIGDFRAGVGGRCGHCSEQGDDGRSAKEQIIHAGISSVGCAALFRGARPVERMSGSELPILSFQTKDPFLTIQNRAAPGSFCPRAG